MDEHPTCMRLPPEPTWKSVYGHNGKITYDLHWLQANALNWHTFVDGDKVMLNYLSSYEMPLAESPALTPEQEDMVRRIVAEEIKQLEKRITNVVIYDLSQRMKQLNSKKEQS